MTTVKKIFVPDRFRIYDAGGDLHKDWFVWWLDKDLKRQTKQTGINKHRCAEKRYQAIYALIDELKNPDPDAEFPPLIQQMRACIRAKKNKLRPKTFQDYQSKLKIFTAYYQGETMGVPEAGRFLDYLIEERGLSLTTRNDYRVFMKMVFRWLVKREYVHFNPFDATEKEASRTTPARPFSKAQIAHLKPLILHYSPSLWLFIQFIYYCFARPGELRLMKVSDILWDERELLFRSEISKNKKEQYITIPDAFFSMVEKHFFGVNPTYYLFGKEEKPGPDTLGKNRMSNLHRNLLRKHNYASAHKLYSWKNTGAVMAAKAGIDIKQLQLQLRHHSLDQVDEYLQSLGVKDLRTLAREFPEI